MQQIHKLIIIVIAVFTVSGCAFGTRQMELSYTPMMDPGTEKQTEIYVGQFKDERTEKSVVGHVRNGYGMKTADVVTSTNISQWAANALKAELKNAGYKITENKNHNVTAAGEVIIVYCDSFINYEGKAVIELILKKDGKELISKKYEGNCRGLNWAATANGYKVNIEGAMQQAISNAVMDILATLD